MRVYKGPASKPFMDDTHEFVDAVVLGAWAGSIPSLNHAVSFNVTKKDDPERRSTATAVLGAAEVAELHHSLVAHLLARAERCELLERALLDIYTLTGLQSRDARDAIEQRVNSILGNTAEERQAALDEFKAYYSRYDR